MLDELTRCSHLWVLFLHFPYLRSQRPVGPLCHLTGVKAVPSVRVSWMPETATLLLVLSELLSGRSYHAAFRCSTLRAPSIFAHAARQPLSCPPHASEIGEACLIFLSALLGVDSPQRRFLPFPWIGPDFFLQTGYLPVLADSVGAPTALFQVNFLALARSRSGLGDFLRALMLGLLFRCWFGIRRSSWPPLFIWLVLLLRPPLSLTYCHVVLINTGTKIWLHFLRLV